MKFIQHQDGDRLTLTPLGARPERVHVFAQDDIDALNAALAAERPLLLRGEPGVGKSQLALAAAMSLERAYLQHVVDARTEARDLLYRFDAVARLADAQLIGALGSADPEDAKATRRALDVERYLQPAVLWWALNWQDARGQAKTAKLAAPGSTLRWIQPTAPSF